jgi:hypothetical protein
MRALAATGHPRAVDLVEKADDFDAKAAAHYAKDGGPHTAKSMLGAWARARRLWSECTGEPLV